MYLSISTLKPELSNSSVRLYKVLLASSILGAMLVSQPVFAIGYTVTILPGLGGKQDSARALSDSGFVVGNSKKADGTNYSVRWNKDGTITEITPSGIPYDVNNSGTVVGQNSAVFEFKNDIYTVISSGYFARINDAGVILGGGNTQPYYILEDGVMTLIGDFGGDYATPKDINNAGQVVGFYSYTTVPDGGVQRSARRAFILDGENATFIEPAGGLPENNSTIAYGINDAGQVVGTTTLDDFSSKVFIWENGIMTVTDINALNNGGDYLVINNTGVVLSDNYIYYNGTKIEARDLLPPDRRDEWFGFSLDDINDAGQIVATGMHFDLTTYKFEYEVVLLTPIPTCY